MLLLKSCPDCSIEYPIELLNQQFIDGEYHLVCPICALLKRNEVIGLPRHEYFQGEIANSLFEDAMFWLKKKKIKHPKW